MPVWNFMSLRENKMKEIVYIYWEDCSKCHQLRPHVEKWASDNGYNFQAVKYAESELQVASIPIVQLIENGKESIYDFDWIVNLISNKK